MKICDFDTHLSPNKPTLPHVISTLKRSRATALNKIGAASGDCNSPPVARDICRATPEYSAGCIRSSSPPTFSKKKTRNKIFKSENSKSMQT